MPALPGAQRTSETNGSARKACTIACSRPPGPKTKVFTFLSVVVSGRWLGGMSEICGDPTRLVAMSFRRRHLPYGQGPLFPRWLQIIYVWLMIMLSCSWVSWLGFRTFAAATRRDIGYALAALGIGAVASTIVTWAVYRKKSNT